jgi:hypothetical protein
VSYSFMVGCRPARGLYTLLTDPDLVRVFSQLPVEASLSVARTRYLCFA